MHQHQDLATPSKQGIRLQVPAGLLMFVLHGCLFFCSAEFVDAVFQGTDPVLAVSGVPLLGELMQLMEHNYSQILDNRQPKLAPRGSSHRPRQSTSPGKNTNARPARLQRPLASSAATTTTTTNKRSQPAGLPLQQPVAAGATAGSVPRPKPQIPQRSQPLAGASNEANQGVAVKRQQQQQKPTGAIKPFSIQPRRPPHPT